MPIVLVAENIPKNIINSLNRLRFTVIFTKKLETVDESIAFHPDIQLFTVNDFCVSVKENYDYYSNIFKKYNINLNLLSAFNNISKPYPFDTALNIYISDHNAVLKEKSADNTVLIYLKENKYRIINVNQGYSSCSIACVAQNAAITEDKGIFNILTKNNFDVLLLNNKEVILKGQNCGFIGGACFYFDNKLYFFGDIKKHSEYIKIKCFCEKYNVELISLSDEKIEDFGKAFVFFN